MSLGKCIEEIEALAEAFKAGLATGDMCMKVILKLKEEKGDASRIEGTRPR